MCDEQSLSISPNLSPPWRALPSVGCRVKTCTRPAPCMELGTDKVVKSLIKYHPGENFCLENFAGLAIDHRFSARMVESLL